jgi:hypothetical protein
MGHSWREMCPGEAAEHDKRIERRRAAMEGMKAIKVGDVSIMEMIACIAVAQGEDNDELLAVVERVVANAPHEPQQPGK